MKHSTSKGLAILFALVLLLGCASKPAPTAVVAQSDDNVELAPLSDCAVKSAPKEVIAHSGGNNVSARTHEEIALVIHSYKNHLLAIYQRALREDPTLRGQVVFEFTIEPSGKVCAVKVLSSDLKNESLEKKLASRIKMFKFGAKDVEVMIVTVPIDFYPS